MKLHFIRNIITESFIIVTLISANHFSENRFSTDKLSADSLIWQWQNPLPTANLFSDIKFVNDLTGWASGTCGIISKTTDGGLSWENQKTGTTADLMSLSFTDILNGWASGKNGTLINTTDGGNNWINRSFTQSPVTKVIFPSRNTGWIIVGSDYSDKGRLYKTTDGGKSWNNLIPSGGDAGNLFVLSEFTCFVSVLNFNESKDRLFRSTDGGVSWTAIDSTVNYYPFDFVFFRDQNNGWVHSAGTSGKYGYTEFESTTDGGRTWNELKINNEDILKIYFTDALHGWAVGVTNYFRTDDGGAYWKVIDLQGKKGSSAYLKDGLIYNAGNGLLKSTDGGDSWIDLIKGSRETLKSVSFSTVQAGCAVGTNGAILWTSDGGKNWTKVDSIRKVNLNSVCMKGMSGWCAGDMANNLGIILKTSDSGKTWKEQKSNYGTNIKSISFVDENNGYAIGNGRYIIKTTDGGSNWVPVDIGVLDSYVSICFTSVSSGWIAGGYGKVYKTTDGGLTWTFKDPQTSTYINRIFFLDDLNGWVAGANGMIWKTTNGGNYWIKKTITGRNFKDVHFCDLNNGILVGQTGLVYQTTDGGITWLPVKVLGEYSTNYYWNYLDANGVFLIDNSNAWIVGTSGTILRRGLNSVLDIKESGYSKGNIPHKYYLSQNYPNPFNPTTNITYSIPESRQVKLVVYDMLGKEISTLVNEYKQAGSYTIQFNAANLPSGIYFYRLEAGSFIDTRKLILLK